MTNAALLQEKELPLIRFSSARLSHGWEQTTIDMSAERGKQVNLEADKREDLGPRSSPEFYYWMYIR